MRCRSVPWTRLGRFWRYTRIVRVYVAVILALFLVTIACTDPLYCADGCDRGGTAATHTTPTGADCPSCLSAIVPHLDTPIVRRENATQVREAVASEPVSAFLTAVDHPPRLT